MKHSKLIDFVNSNKIAKIYMSINFFPPFFFFLCSSSNGSASQDYPATNICAERRLDQ